MKKLWVLITFCWSLSYLLLAQLLWSQKRLAGWTCCQSQRFTWIFCCSLLKISLNSCTSTSLFWLCLRLASRSLAATPKTINQRMLKMMIILQKTTRMALSLNGLRTSFSIHFTRSGCWGSVSLNSLNRRLTMRKKNPTTNPSNMYCLGTSWLQPWFRRLLWWTP